MKRVILIWAACFLVIATGAHAAPPPRMQLASAIQAHDSTVAHLHVYSVRCALADESQIPHVYFCEETFSAQHKSKRYCLTVVYHFYKGQINDFRAAWPCGTKPPIVIPPFPGDAPRQPGAPE